MNNKTLLIKLKKYLSMYASGYDSSALEYINDNFFKFINRDDAPDILMQIYSELGVYSDKNNFYMQHVNNIKQNFDIGTNILDIGSGCMPAFANLLAQEQLKLGSGTITLYDPLLVMKNPKYKNMKLNKTLFTNDMSVESYDIITGILPCDATELIIQKACENRKNFYVAMCGCDHSNSIYSNYYYGLDDYENYYQEFVIDKTLKLLKKYDNGTLKIQRLPSSFSIYYPILFNKKK